MAKPIRYCTVDDCTRPRVGRGLCRMHYLRLRRAGTLPPLVIPTTLERLLALINPNGPVMRPELGACAVWAGRIHVRGYGQFQWNGTPWLAHRAAWTLMVGPIPEGKWVLHRCDNPPCAGRLDHLFLGDPADNAQDMVAKGRHRSQLRTKAKMGP